MKTFRLFKVAGVQYLVMPNCTGVTIVDDSGNLYGTWQCEAHFRASIKRGQHRTVSGVNIPTSEPIGRAYPQIAHGEIRVSMPVA